MSMFDTDTAKQLTGILNDLQNPIKIKCFFGDSEKNNEARQFVTEFSEFSPKITLVAHDNTDLSLMQEWNVTAELTPAIFVTTEDESLKGVGFLGTPGGFEINSFLMSLLEVSGKVEALDPKYDAVKSVANLVEIYCFISLTCPKCPQAVMNIHRLAIENRNIKSYMIEAPAFKEFTEGHEVQAFPTIKIGDKSLVGDNTHSLEQLVAML